MVIGVAHLPILEAMGPEERGEPTLQPMKSRFNQEPEPAEYEWSEYAGSPLPSLPNQHNLFDLCGSNYLVYLFYGKEQTFQKSIPLSHFAFLKASLS